MKRFIRDNDEFGPITFTQAKVLSETFLEALLLKLLQQDGSFHTQDVAEEEEWYISNKRESDIANGSDIMTNKVLDLNKATDMGMVDGVLYMRVENKTYGWINNDWIADPDGIDNLNTDDRNVMATGDDLVWMGIIPFSHY